MVSFSSIKNRRDFQQFVASEDFASLRKLLGDILYAEFYFELMNYVNHVNFASNKLLNELISHPPYELVKALEDRVRGVLQYGDHLAGIYVNPVTGMIEMRIPDFSYPVVNTQMSSGLPFYTRPSY